MKDRSPLIEIGDSLRDYAGRVMFLLLSVALVGICCKAESKDRAAAASAAALFEAAHRGDVSGVAEAVGAGANVNDVESGSRMTPLLWAARGGHCKVADWLLQHGAELNAAIPGYGTPLATAAANEDGSAMVRLLLERGADPNRCASDGHTPLMRAAEYGDAASAALLIRAGANLNARDHWGNTPTLTAIENGHPEIVRQLAMAGAHLPANAH
jgi:ankyrin repeat protein